MSVFKIRRALRELENSARETGDFGKFFASVVEGGGPVRFVSTISAQHG